MPEKIPKHIRSRMMAGIKGTNTRPERQARSILHRLGFRFRLHRQDLPGRPDIVLPRYRLAVQVHGCFWHRHPGCRYATSPKSNTRFWNKKLNGNADRDRRTLAELRERGWRTLVIWECVFRDERLLARLPDMLRKAVISTKAEVQIPARRMRRKAAR